MARRRLYAVAEFIHTEAAGGIVLAAAALVAVLLANSPLAETYESALHTTHADVVISDGLMTVFFLIVGLEIAREFREGELRDRRAALMPVVAAVGGMVVPAAAFLSMNAAGGGARGWAIPTATDIAFALGVVTLLGSRVPPALRVFLLALAIADDIGAIVVLALFYSDSPSVVWLAAAGIALGGYAVLARVARSRAAAVPLVALLCGGWFALHEAGVHPTLVGVGAGLLTPRSFAVGLQSRLHPWSVALVLPLFALANAGISFTGAGDALTSRIGLGIALGLVFGKPVGIVGASVVAARLLRSPLPGGASLREMTGIGFVAGIGFTVSLFVTPLAYAEPGQIAAAKVGIGTGSLVAALLGASLLAVSARRGSSPEEREAREEDA